MEREKQGRKASFLMIFYTNTVKSTIHFGFLGGVQIVHYLPFLSILSFDSS